MPYTIASVAQSCRDCESEIPAGEEHFGPGLTLRTDLTTAELIDLDMKAPTLCIHCSLRRGRLAGRIEDVPVEEERRKATDLRPAPQPAAPGTGKLF